MSGRPSLGETALKADCRQPSSLSPCGIYVSGERKRVSKLPLWSRRWVSPLRKFVRDGFRWSSDEAASLNWECACSKSRHYLLIHPVHLVKTNWVALHLILWGKESRPSPCRGEGRSGYRRWQSGLPEGWLPRSAAIAPPKYSTDRSGWSHPLGVVVAGRRY